MQWQKKGFIYTPDGTLDFSVSHAQVPVVDIISSENIYRVYFATRDKEGKSRVSSIDLSIDDPKKIISLRDTPVLDLGETGTFDDSGVMPSWIVNHDNKKYLYYIGWNVRNTIPYHNSVGVAVSDDGGRTFNRINQGPVIDRSRTEPFFNGSSCVIIEGGVWKNWYLSCTEWRKIKGKMEPRYHIKYAESKNGLDWDRKGVVAIDYRDDDEAGIVKASVMKHRGTYLMWYSYRNFVDYRTSSNNSYKIGFAESEDGISWIRKDNQVGINLSASGWDSEMMAYPHVIKDNNKLLMFYNGNGFGASGFGYATLPI